MILIPFQISHKLPLKFLANRSNFYNSFTFMFRRNLSVVSDSKTLSYKSVRFAQLQRIAYLDADLILDLKFVYATESHAYSI